MKTTMITIKVMITNKVLGMACLLAAAAMGVVAVSAATPKAAPQTPLTDAGKYGQPMKIYTDN